MFLLCQNKCLFQSVLTTAYFNHYFWSKTLKNKLEAQDLSAEQLLYKTVFPDLVLLLKTS